jgi:hypothetical protein
VDLIQAKYGPLSLCGMLVCGRMVMALPYFELCQEHVNRFGKVNVVEIGMVP